MKPLDIAGFFFLTSSNIFAAGPTSGYHLTMQFVYLALALLAWGLAWRLK